VGIASGNANAPDSRRGFGGGQWMARQTMQMRQ